MPDISRILLIDSEPSSLRSTVANLNKQDGYEVLQAKTGKEGLRILGEQGLDLVLADAILPDMEDFEICRQIRVLTDIPFIIISSRQREEDVIRGLEAGADDYLIKPFRMGELLARVKALLRRAQMNPTHSPTWSIYQDDWLSIDLTGRAIEVKGERVKLSPTEFNLLSYLVRNAGCAVKTQDILEEIWGDEYVSEVAYVRVYVSYLRQKIEPDPANPSYILTEYRVGYRFARQENHI